MKRVGLFLGSFDPPHIGHIYVAEVARDSLDEVWVIPAWGNPWKTGQTAYIDRLRMCEGTFRGMNRVVSVHATDRYEYSHELLRSILKMYDEDYEFWIVAGTDVAKSIVDWKESEWILRNFKVLEIPRRGFPGISEGITCSSSDLRKKILEGSDVSGFIEEKTLGYIKQKHLYEKQNQKQN